MTLPMCTDQTSIIKHQTSINLVNADGPVIDLSVPSYSDFLVAYSTLEGHVSWRDHRSGSWFIQDLVRALSTLIHSPDEDLCSILTNVAYAISQRSTQGCRQISEVRST